jgi:ATP-dependent Clp protease ATP-binding subunit ClpC
MAGPAVATGDIYRFDVRRMDTMENLEARYFSARSVKARFGARISNKLIDLLLMLGLAAGGIGGALLLYSGLSLGWLGFAATSCVAMLMVWQKRELNDIPPIKGGSRIDDVLDARLLGVLPRNPSPKQLAEALMKVPGGQFFAARFGVGPSFLTQLVSDNPSDTGVVWQEALKLQQQLGAPGLSAAIVTAALVRSIPNAEGFLAHLQLSADDITTGAEWYEHLQALIAKHKVHHRTGGMARDWSFGYTPMLNRFGINLSNRVAGGNHLATELETHQDALKQMFNVMGGGGRQNVALVGPLGVGKSTIVEAFAVEMLKADANMPSKLRFRQVITLDAGTLISQAHGRGELENLVNQLFMEAYKAKNIILFLDDAQLFFEEGVGSVDMSNLLLPVLDGGGLPLMLAMDEQRWLQISQRTPALTTTLNRIMVAEPSRDETMRVLQDQLIMLEFRNKVTYMFQSLNEAYRLSERYLHEQAMPGKAIKLLQAAAGFADNGLITAESVRQAVEKTMDVKVSLASTSDERQTLLDLESKIHERMINQSRAVQVVSDALRRARTGVRNQDRPVGTFLFLGPTGVGKTELARSLAAVYFGGEDRMIRLDMNEYVQPSDVTRLIADGANDPHSLAAQVSKQPFSVVLLDELEKAHPDVLNTLLQLLDEGVLRDINNRSVSFKDAIIIATSNAGADKIRAHIEAGEQLEQFEQPFIDELINSRIFLPEFLNRFDEIVVFRPLTKQELLQVVDLILASINKNMALQKITVAVADDAKGILVDAGYDPRLGARPLRRVVQRTVESLVAKQMLGGQVMPGQTIQITAQDVQGALGNGSVAQSSRT